MLFLFILGVFALMVLAYLAVRAVLQAAANDDAFDDGDIYIPPTTQPHRQEVSYTPVVPVYVPTSRVDDTPSYTPPSVDTTPSYSSPDPTPSYSSPDPTPSYSPDPSPPDFGGGSFGGGSSSDY